MTSANQFRRCEALALLLSAILVWSCGDKPPPPPPAATAASEQAGAEASAAGGGLAVLSGLPEAQSNVATLSISVAGAEVATYRYALRPDWGSCGPSDYSSVVAVGTPISVHLETDGLYRLCVLGRTSEGQEQEVPSEFAWMFKADKAPLVGTVPSQPELLSMTIAAAKNPLPSGESTLLAATGSFADGTTAVLDDGLEWTIDSQAAGTISSTGLWATDYRSIGASVVTAKFVHLGKTVTGSLNVEVLAITGLTFSTPPLVMMPGGTRQFGVTATRSDGSTVPSITPLLEFQSEAPGVAAVAGGVVQALSVGTTRVLAAFERANGTLTAAALTVQVVAPAPSPSPSPSP